MRTILFALYTIMHESTPLSHYVFTQVYKSSPMSYTAPDLNHDSSTNALSAASKKRDEPLTMPWRLASNRTTIKIDMTCVTFFLMLHALRNFVI